MTWTDPATLVLTTELEHFQRLLQNGAAYLSKIQDKEDAMVADYIRALWETACRTVEAEKAAAEMLSAYHST